MEGNYDKHSNILDKDILNYYKLQTWGKHCKCGDQIVKNTKKYRNSVALFLPRPLQVKLSYKVQYKLHCNK